MFQSVIEASGKKKRGQPQAKLTVIYPQKARKGMNVGIQGT